MTGGELVEFRDAFMHAINERNYNHVLKIGVDPLEIERIDPDGIPFWTRELNACVQSHNQQLTWLFMLNAKIGFKPSSFKWLHESMLANNGTPHGEFIRRTAFWLAYLHECNEDAADYIMRHTDWINDELHVNLMMNLSNPNILGTERADCRHVRAIDEFMNAFNDDMRLKHIITYDNMANPNYDFMHELELKTGMRLIENDNNDDISANDHEFIIRELKSFKQSHDIETCYCIDDNISYLTRTWEYARNLLSLSALTLHALKASYELTHESLDTKIPVRFTDNIITGTVNDIIDGMPDEYIIESIRIRMRIDD